MSETRVSDGLTPLRPMGVALRGALMMFRRDRRLFFSYRLTWISQIVQIATTLTLFYYVSRLVNVPSVGSPDKYFASVVVGLAVLETLSATLVTLPIAVRQELVAGTFERLVISPLGAVWSMLGMLLFPFLSTLIVGVLTMIVAAVIFGMPVQWDTAALYIPLAMLGALAYAPFAILVTSAVLVMKQAGAGASFVMTGISLSGGFFFPVHLLPPAIRWISDVQPFTPTLGLMRHVVIGTKLDVSTGVSVAKVVGFAVVLLPVSVLALQRAVSYAQRRGTIIEY